jgi:outer membrane protein assembly factor BamB
MQSGDVQRNGFVPNTNISSRSASSLKVAWSITLDDSIKASPIVAGGRVFVFTYGGGIVALDQNTGAQLWSIPSATLGFISGTPSVDGNMLIVPIYSQPAVAALDVATGAILWKRASADWGGIGNVRTEPLVANGMVYVGTASGDPISGCYPGTVAALNELTGSIVWSFMTARAGEGAAVWSPISLTPFGDVTFGTGNACANGIKYFESVLALNAANGTFHWQAISSQPGSDDDIGGGVAEAGGRGFFTGKDGKLYAIDLSNGAPLWSRALGSIDDYGSIATPATDGSNVVTQTGALIYPQTTTQPQANLNDYGIDGSLRWSVGPFVKEQFSSPVITNDVVIVGVDSSLQVRSLQSGALVWSYPTDSFVYSSPAVVKNAIYIASHGTSTTGGTLTALTINGAAANVKSRFVHVYPRQALREFHPWVSERGR